MRTSSSTGSRQRADNALRRLLNARIWSPRACICASISARSSIGYEDGYVQGRLGSCEVETKKSSSRDDSRPDATRHDHVFLSRNALTSASHYDTYNWPRSMVYLSPPHLSSALRPSYAQAYNNILATHRRSPLTSASSVIILVPPDIDALCAARMLADLFKQDDVMHRIIPVSGIAELERMRDELVTYADVRVSFIRTACLRDIISSYILSSSSTWVAFWTSPRKSGSAPSQRSCPCTSSILRGRRTWVTSSPPGMPQTASSSGTTARSSGYRRKRQPGRP
jgi:hypothetical protein